MLKRMHGPRAFVAVGEEVERERLGGSIEGAGIGVPGCSVPITRGLRARAGRGRSPAGEGRRAVQLRRTRRQGCPASSTTGVARWPQHRPDASPMRMLLPTICGSALKRVFQSSSLRMSPGAREVAIGKSSSPKRAGLVRATEIDVAARGSCAKDSRETW